MPIRGPERGPRAPKRRCVLILGRGSIEREEQAERLRREWGRQRWSAMLLEGSDESVSYMKDVYSFSGTITDISIP